MAVAVGNAPNSYILVGWEDPTLGGWWGCGKVLRCVINLSSYICKVDDNVVWCRLNGACRRSPSIFLLSSIWSAAHHRMNRFDGITKLLGVRLRIGRAVPRRRCLQRPKSTVTMGFRRKFKKCKVKPAQTLGRPSPPPHSSLRKVIESPPGCFFQTVDVCRCTRAGHEPRSKPRSTSVFLWPLIWFVLVLVSFWFPPLDPQR